MKTFSCYNVLRLAARALWSSADRGGLAIGRTGTIPGGLAANLARYPTFFYLFFCCCFCLPNVYSPFNNKTPINHESASLLGWQRDSPHARSAHPCAPKGCETREWSRSAQVEQRGKTVLFMTSSAVQLHL